MPNNQVVALLQRARAGDAEAFERLIAPQVGRLYNYLARMVGDPSDAEDLTQEVILRAHRAIGSFHGGATFQTWLYRIATNIAVDALRRRGRRDARVTSLDDPLQAEQGMVARDVRDTQRDPQQLAEASELADRVQKAISELSPKLRAVVILFDLEGFTYDEIAEALRLPLGTVKSRLFNARSKLRELLRPYVVGAV